VAACQAHEYIFQARLPRGQMLQLATLPLDRFQQSGNGQMRLFHVQRNQAIVFANRLYAGQSAL